MTLFERDSEVGGLWKHSVKIPKPCTDGGSVDGEALAGTLFVVDGGVCLFCLFEER